MSAPIRLPLLSGGQQAALFAYATLLRLGMPAYLWRVWSRGRQEPDYRARWWERLGLYGRTHLRSVESSRQRGGPLVWVHAVSLGEARAASGLVAALRQARPDMRLLLTHTTATGMDAGADLVREARGDLHTWLPLDTPGSVRRFLRTHRPAVGVLMETEVWPVLQREAARANLPMVLANARLSDKSLRQGLRFAALLRPAARAMTAVLAQTKADADRIVRLLDLPEGPDTAHVQVCGNLKFDMTPDASLLGLGQAWRQASVADDGVTARPLVLAASTREGEEAGLLQAWQQMLRALPDGAVRPRLLLVPRHPQRFDEVATLIGLAGLSLSRRSAWVGPRPEARALLADVWLGDSMKEMAAYYAASGSALLGGSFEPLGGQNLIEAAACGCPVVMGPSTFNFAEAAELSEQSGAAFRVSGWEEGVRQAVALAQAESRPAEARRQACLGFALAHRGAAVRMAGQVLGLATG